MVCTVTDMTLAKGTESLDDYKESSAGAKTFSQNASRVKKKSANRARHRLLSIRYDVENYLKPLIQAGEEERSRINLKNLPIVANERCGTWYALPFHPHSFCHFKSTDGHDGSHLFSLKRLNLAFLKTVATEGSVVILDASNKKEMPDSFSRTIPIWACVLNRISQRYRLELGMEDVWSEWGDGTATNLHVPDWIVFDEESETIESIIDRRVEELYQSRAIVDIPSFVALFSKPLRPYWITPFHSVVPTTDGREPQSRMFHNIICCNASNVRLNGNNAGNNSNSRVVWREDQQFWYTPGAADDQESWAKHLTPSLFWEHAHKFSSDLSDQQTEDLIESIVREAAVFNVNNTINGEDSSLSDSLVSESYDWIGNINIAIGTRRSGRPPECWGTFDAILNVTKTEYDNMLPSPEGKFYLQLPVEEGKRDKHELERWLPVGILFCTYHAIQNRRILIHCAQGRDRSVAVAMAVVQIFCTLRYPLEWNKETMQTVLNGLMANMNDEASSSKVVHPTAGFPQKFCTIMLGQEGRDMFVTAARRALSLNEESPIATKETLRVVLHLVRQDREKAEPTRSTMQKLNRFFMSKAFEPLPEKKQ